ncbi:MAG: hypothetical protein ACLTER_11255 [Ruminococcus sp.]
MLLDTQREYLDILDECLPLITDAMYETDSKERFQAVNEVLVVLWKYLKPLAEEAKQAQTQGNGQQFAEETGSLLNGQIVGGSPLPNGKGKPKIKVKGKVNPVLYKRAGDSPKSTAEGNRPTFFDQNKLFIRRYKSGNYQRLFLCRLWLYGG